MADQFFYARHQEQFGPFSAGQLKGFAASGRLRPTDTVWKEGMAKGVPAATVKYLFPDPAGEALLTGAPPAEVPSSPDAAPPARSGTSPLRSGEQPTPTGPAPEGWAHEPVPEAVALAGAEPALSPPPTDTAGAGSSGEAPASPKQPGARQWAVRKLRADGVKGAIILSQDGAVVHFRKKCVTCGFDDLTKSSMPIRIGSMRMSFFCRKCRKLRDVELRGIA